MIDNLKLNSILNPVSNSAKIQKTGDRDGGRERRRFEEEMDREGLGRKATEERVTPSKGVIEEADSALDMDIKDTGLGKVVDIRV